MSPLRIGSMILTTTLFLVLGGVWMAACPAQDDVARSPREARMVRVDLPIGHASVQRIKNVLGNLAAKAPAVVQPADRTVVVLEFATGPGQNGSGSQLADCMELARFLSGGELKRLQVVAWIPAARLGVELPGSDGPALPPGLYGHAVLPALCSDLLVIEEGMSIGQADLDQSQPDPLARDIYRNLAGQRLLVPLPLAMSMIDPERALYAVRTTEGQELVEEEQLKELEAAGKVVELETLATSGKTARYTAAQLRRLAANCREVRGRDGLAALLRVDLSRIEPENEITRPWKALRQDFDGFIDGSTVEWTIRAIDQRTRGSEGVNLVILTFDSPGGDTQACLKLARFLSAFDSSQIRTVAWVRGEARGPAGLVAVACDHLLLQREATLGGRWKPGLSLAEEEGLADDLNRLAEELGRDPALLAGLIDTGLEIDRFRNRQTGEVRWMLPDRKAGGEAGPEQADQWALVSSLDPATGFAAADLAADGVARGLVENDPELAVFYQLEGTPELLKPTRADAALLSLARFLASPMVSVWLLFFGFMLIMTELSHPGVGLPGFAGTLSLALYFWSHFLGGSAEWFEILLFGVGVAFILIELFLLPGFGLFGIAGVLMCVASIVLAAQTFVIPRNSEEFAQLPASLLMIAGAGAGFLGAIFLLRRVLPHTPWFRRIVLEPPASGPWEETSEGPASAGLPRPGATGVAQTRLIPAGKARIGGRLLDVITDGVAVDAGQRVEVTEAKGNRIVVRPVADRGGAS